MTTDPVLSDPRVGDCSHHPIWLACLTAAHLDDATAHLQAIREPWWPRFEVLRDDTALEIRHHATDELPTDVQLATIRLWSLAARELTGVRIRPLDVSGPSEHRPWFAIRFSALDAVRPFLASHEYRKTPLDRLLDAARTPHERLPCKTFPSTAASPSSSPAPPATSPAGSSSACSSED